jgi:spore coat-associated protein N
MRKSVGLLAGMALSALVLIGLTVTADTSSAAFTATTTNPGNSFASATLAVSNDKSAAASLVSLTNMIPGDTANRTVVIQNTGTGTVGFTYTGAISATASTLLWSDATNGLQVTVTRSGVVTPLYTGTLKNMVLAASPTIAVGGTDTLSFTFSLPTTADNTFQTLTQDFTITYTATQLAGTTR